MFSFRKPTPSEIQGILDESHTEQLTYPEIGQSRTNQLVAGYNNDFNRAYLGEGQDVFEAACGAIRAWEMFPGGWAYIEPKRAPIQEGQIVAMVAKVAGLYWANNCRIIYSLDEEKPVRRFGFAYGTLQRHVEMGEERFSIEWLPDNSVWYDLRAYSKPRYWMARMAAPIARVYQKKFVRESKLAMQKAVEETLKNNES